MIEKAEVSPIKRHLSGEKGVLIGVGETNKIWKRGRFYFLNIFGIGFHGDTFRVIKEMKEKQLGKYRTRRLVLEAWDSMDK